MTRWTQVVAAALAAAMIAFPATASAHKPKYTNTTGSALRDCSAGHYPLKGHYTIKVLQAALKKLDTGTLQYTNCADVLTHTIAQLELAARGKGRAHTAGSVTLPGRASNVIKSRLHALKKSGSLPVILPGGQTVTPGVVTARSSSLLSSLPTPLLIVLAALLATVLAVSARAINNLVRTRRTH
jgi:hypothetical protein